MFEPKEKFAKMINNQEVIIVKTLNILKIIKKYNILVPISPENLLYVLGILVCGLISISTFRSV